MAKTTGPSTFLIAQSMVNADGLSNYLNCTDQSDFNKDIAKSGLRDTLGILVSFAAKVCYASLVPGKNDNLTKIRSIRDNIRAVLDSGHGSVLEHASLTFITTGCSRVFTHELVRHRVGTAFSQTSGRYVRTDEIEFVNDPILEPVINMILGAMDVTEGLYKACSVLMGLGDVIDVREMIVRAKDLDEMVKMLQRVPNYKISMMQDSFYVEVTPLSFDEKKKRTSALRRMLPNGQSNEIVWTVNIRQLRHMLMLRTNRHAEWEIRKVFNDVWLIVNQQFPDLFSDARVEMVDGLLEVTGMKTQPYDKE